MTDKTRSLEARERAALALYKLDHPTYKPEDFSEVAFLSTVLHYRERAEAAWLARNASNLPSWRVQLERAEAEYARRTSSPVGDRAAVGGAMHGSIVRAQRSHLSDSKRDPRPRTGTDHQAATRRHHTSRESRTMTVSILFEIQTTPDEPLNALLTEIDALPYWERQLMTARVMRFRADQMADEAAGHIAIQAAEDRRQERIRATRARNRAAQAAEQQERAER